MLDRTTLIILIAAAVCAVILITLLILMARKKKSSAIIDDELLQSEQLSDEDGRWIGKVIMSCDAGDIHAPVDGKVKNYKEIPDETFASGALGEGVGIDPAAEDLYAPFDGTISTVAESKQAIGITGPGEMELLLHAGVDTISMNGDGFTTFVKEGDKVETGQKLMHFDRKKIAAAGYPDMVVVLLTNSGDMKNFKIQL